MNIVIPMAGKGKRLRPHTLSTPKPLIPVGGKPIVHRLIEDIAETVDDQIEQLAFVVGEIDTDVEKKLIKIGQQFATQVKVYYQNEALGTAHAVWCAKEMLTGPTVVAYADTLFRAKFKINSNDEGILWVKQIDDPSSFGVVKLNDQQHIVSFVEKPKDFVSDLAMIGIYYFREGELLKKEIEYLIEHNIAKQGEYQLPDALKRLVDAGVIFKTGEVQEWLDCGNPTATIYTNKRVLELDQEKKRIFKAKSLQIEHSLIIQPCFIGENANIINSVVGPHVSIGANTTLIDTRIQNTLIGSSSVLKNVVVKDSMIGSYVYLDNNWQRFSVGDHTVIKTKE